MKKLICLLTIALASVCWGQTCDSTTNRDSGGKPCTNIVTSAGPATSGLPVSYALNSQDGKANTNTAYGIFGLNTAFSTYLPNDPLVNQFGFNVTSPNEDPYGSISLSGLGQVTGTAMVNTTPVLSEGGVVIVPDTKSYLHSFYYSIVGLPTTVDITLSLCYQGSCSVINTYTNTASGFANVNVGTQPHDSLLVSVATLDGGATMQLENPCSKGNRAWFFTENYSLSPGAETINPPDANGNNTYTWAGTLSVPFTFDHCISNSGRGGGYGTSATYFSGRGQGELSATGSIQ